MRYWSYLFILGVVFCTAIVLYAPFHNDWWLPSYLDTNRAGVTSLRAVQRGVEALANRQARLIAQTEQQEGSAEVADALRDLRTEAQLHQQTLIGLAERNLLPQRMRNAADLLAQAAEAQADAQNTLAQNVTAAQDAQRTALDDLQGARGELAAALAEVRTSTSSMGKEIDLLFWIILIITGVVFLGTQVALCLAAFRYIDLPGRQADYFHGSQRLEVVWTIIPAAVLVFIALYQMGTWAAIKFRSEIPRVQPLAEVTARQFQWVIRYPGPDGRLNTADDIITVNDLHFVKDAPAVIHLKSSDVLHSFFLPQMRIKQDAVPGLTIPVWFDADKAGHYELLCAELCGWGHYKMRANVTVHETQSEFDDWLETVRRAQMLDQLAATDDAQE